MMNMFETHYCELLDWMYEQSEKGIVNLPVEINTVGECQVGEYVFSWKKEDVDALKKAVEQHIRLTKEIADAGVEPDTPSEEAQAQLQYNPQKYIFWKTYLRDFNRVTGIDPLEMAEVSDDLENLEECRKLAEKLYREKSLSENESEILSLCAKISIPKEKLERYYLFQEKRAEEARRRLPNVRDAISLLIETSRLFRLFLIDAPDFIINIRYNRLAIAMAYGMFGVSYRLTDKPCDDHSFSCGGGARPNGRASLSNTRKSLIPLYAYQIIKNKSSRAYPITQERIREMLAAYPYEIAIERKSLGRVIECLAREDIGVYKCRKGVYYEAKGMEL